MLVALQLLGIAVVPLIVTVLEPCVAPKLAPVSVIKVPGGAEMEERLVSAGPVVGVGAGRISTALRL